MNISVKNRYLLLSSLCVLGTTPYLHAFQQEVLRREVTRTSEKEVSISLDASFGTLNILRGTSNKIVAAEYSRENDDKRQLEMFYDIEDGRGNLEINLTDEKRRQEHGNATKVEKFTGEEHWILLRTNHRIEIGRTAEVG